MPPTTGAESHLNSDTADVAVAPLSTSVLVMLLFQRRVGVSELPSSFGNGAYSMTFGLRVVQGFREGEGLL